MGINQAVLFTKPLHHLGIDLAPEELNSLARDFFEERGFSIVHHRTVAGSELAAREIIRKHYSLYSGPSRGEVHITDAGRAKFLSVFGKEWNAEVEAGRILGNPQWMASKGIDAHELFKLWNAASAQKIQTGLMVAWLAPLDGYGINAFYPAMEANFNHPATRIDYYVVEFNPAQVSWKRFRKEILGATNAARAAPDSFRGRLYARYPVDFPGRDNFMHGSAGPLEAMIERSIHEPDFDLATNPIGCYLETLGVSLDRLNEWMDRQSNVDLGALFEATEEKDSDAVFPILAGVAW